MRADASAVAGEGKNYLSLAKPAWVAAGSPILSSLFTSAPSAPLKPILCAGEWGTCEPGRQRLAELGAQGATHPCGGCRRE